MDFKGNIFGRTVSPPSLIVIQLLYLRSYGGGPGHERKRGLHLDSVKEFTNRYTQKSCPEKTFLDPFCCIFFVYVQQFGVRRFAVHGEV